MNEVKMENEIVKNNKNVEKLERKPAEINSTLFINHHAHAF